MSSVPAKINFLILRSFDPAQVIFISILKIKNVFDLGRATSAKIKIDWHRPAQTTMHGTNTHDHKIIMHRTNTHDRKRA